MRRAILELSIRRILNDLDKSGIIHMFSSLVDRQRVKEQETIPLDVFQKYMVATANYDAATKSIMSILGIAQLLDVNFWTKLQRESEPSLIYPLYSSLRATSEVIPKILELVSQDNIEKVLENSDDLPSQLKGGAIITAILAEEAHTFSSPRRIVEAINAVSDLYSVHAHVLEVRDDDLIFLACDSGSDKSFDFLGLAKVVEGVKETISFLWDRIVYFKNHQARSMLDLISSTLPVIDSINAMESAGGLSPEMAEQLRRKAIGGCMSFIEAGVTTPDMEARSAGLPRELMSPEQKMLPAPRENINATTVRPSAMADQQEFNAQEEIEALKKQLRQTASQNRRSRKSGPIK